jgi:hypothetical protein
MESSTIGGYTRVAANYGSEFETKSIKLTLQIIFFSSLFLFLPSITQSLYQLLYIHYVKKNTQNKRKGKKTPIQKDMTNKMPSHVRPLVTAPRLNFRQVSFTTLSLSLSLTRLSNSSTFLFFL